MNRLITTENVKSMRTLHSTKGIKPNKQILKLGEVQMLRNEDMKSNDRRVAVNGNPFLSIRMKSCIYSTENFIFNWYKLASEIFEHKTHVQNYVQFFCSSYQIR